MSNDEHQVHTLYSVAGQVEDELIRLSIPHAAEVLEEGDGVMRLSLIRIRDVPVGEADRVRGIAARALDGAPILLRIDTI